MRKLVSIMLVMVMMFAFAGMAQADRLTDLRDRYKTLAAQNLQIEREMLLLEGMFMERQELVKEQAVDELEAVVQDSGIEIDEESTEVSEE